MGHSFKILSVLFVALISSATTYWLIKRNTGHSSLERPTDFSKMSAGCVLVAPFLELHPEEFKPHFKPRMFLVNKRTKKTVKSWSADYPIAMGEIDDKGRLWFMTKILWQRFSSAEITAVDTSSKVIETTTLKNLGSDFDLTPSGVITAQHYLSRVQTPKTNEEFKFHRIVEIDLKTQSILWEYDLKKMHPELFKDVSEQQFRGLDMTHVNSIRYIAKNPFTNVPAVLIIIRNISRVLLIEKHSKKVLWMSDLRFEYPHDARILENGNLLVFNNRKFSAYSTAEQVDMINNATVWGYRSFTENEFHSPIMGSAQRLDNGNTLLTQGTRGHVVEVTAEGEAVWEYFQTFEIFDRRSGWPLVPLFRVEQYDPAFVERLGWGDICS